MGLPRVYHRLRIDENGKITRLYNIWKGLRQRCLNPNNPNYKDYGGRGINICKEWDRYSIFYNWAMANGYESYLTIDRENNHLGYNPVNCRWVTITVQANNRRSNRLLEYKGKIQNIEQWSLETGLDYKVISDRLNKLGWSIERSLSIPVKKFENNFIEFKGQIKICAEWARLLGVSHQTLFRRLNVYGWSVEKSLTTPVKKKNNIV